MTVIQNLFPHKMRNLTVAQCHFVKDLINHRLRFGIPKTKIKLDKYRSLAVLKPHQIFGYIRWQANMFGSQDWRFFVIKTCTDGPVTHIPGITPAARLLASSHGTAAVKRALRAIDRLEKETSEGLDTLPESYWRRFDGDISSRRTLRAVPANYRAIVTRL